MKMKTICFVVILIILVTFFINSNIKKEETNFNQLDLNVGDKFEGIDYSNDMYVINYAIGNVASSNSKDMVILVGEQGTQNNDCKANVDVVLYIGDEEKFINANLKSLNCTLSKIMLKDFNDDNVEDIMVVLENEKKEKNIRVLTYQNNSLKEIFGSKENKGIVFVGEVIDGIKAHIKCSKLNKELYIDLSNRKEELINSKKIDESGKILYENKKIVTSPFTSVDIVDINGKNGIQTTQIIYAFDNTEIIDEITTIWKYEDGKWQIKEARGNKIENLVY